MATATTVTVTQTYDYDDDDDHDDHDDDDDDGRRRRRRTTTTTTTTFCGMGPISCSLMLCLRVNIVAVLWFSSISIFTLCARMVLKNCCLMLARRVDSWCSEVSRSMGIMAEPNTCMKAARDSSICRCNLGRGN